MLTLENKNIIIVGGTSGLGLSAAKACIAAGAKIFTFSRNPDKVEQAKQCLGSSAEVVIGSAVDPNFVNSAVETAAQKFGRIHALYHVAGGSGRRMGDGPLHQITDQGWQYNLGLNLSSVFYSNRAVVQQFLQQESSGSILNMGSVLGFSPSPKYFATHAYATSKAALVGMTASMAAYYAPHQIRFNLIAPALTETPMAQRAAENTEIMTFIQQKQPLDGGRIGKPTDLDAAAVFFLSDQSRFVTGQVLAVDGGWSVTDTTSL
jgi:NAD(P)-dependent dehydrogenase (short-subunit alcohol dehydrogenase family)